MSVVNVKVAYIRPEFDNLKEWMDEKNNIYIGRVGVVFVTDSEGNKHRWPPKASIFANPYKLQTKHTFEDMINCLTEYEKHLETLMKNPEIIELMKSFRDKIKKGEELKFGCWCVSCEHKTIIDYKTVTKEFYEKYGLCHGDVLLKKIMSV